MSEKQSWASNTNVARSMKANRRRDTKPELALRRELFAAGCRFRVDFAPVLGLRSRADIVFPRIRLAIYVDGCFWHGCPLHATLPKSNQDYWLPKLRRNMERDRATVRDLEARGWTVMRFWEHTAPDVAALEVLNEIAALRAELRQQ